MNEQRLIDANVLSERLKDLDEWCRDCRKPGIEQARCMVHEMPTVNPFEWISVDDRLPEEDARVLVYINVEKTDANIYTFFDTDRIINGKWVRWNNYISHWMPLPEAPKRGDTNE